MNYEYEKNPLGKLTKDPNINQLLIIIRERDSEIMNYRNVIDSSIVEKMKLLTIIDEQDLRIKKLESMINERV